MQKVLSNALMRSADSYTIDVLKVPSGELMKRAGLALAAEVKKSAKKDMQITVVCGTGNNGGDGYVCASALLIEGYKVKVYATEGKLSADCQREKSAYRGEYSDSISGNIIVDCLFGTGLCRPVEGAFAQAVKEINGLDAYVISADIPSGINGDNGLVCGVAVRADKTVAIAEYKSGHFLNDGIDYCGQIVKVDIGITVPGGNYINLIEEEDIGRYFPRRKRNSNKSTYGTAQLIAGSQKYPGAASLCLQAALQSGCGYVKLKTSPKIKYVLAAKYPQVVFNEEADLQAGCIAIGSGCGADERLYAEVCRLLKNYGGTLVIDADGLNALSKFGKDVLKDKSCDVVLTPHVKEFSRLSGKNVEEVLSSPTDLARAFAAEYGVTLLLKNAVSILTDGENTALLARGNSALAKAGSGDMLTGFACGTAARGIPPFYAAAAASFVLGMSAEICSEERTEYCVTSTHILKNLHLAVRNLTGR